MSANGDAARVADRAEDDGAGEAAEDERVDPEHGEADRAHLGRRGRSEGLEDRDRERCDRGLPEELDGHHHPELGQVQRDREETAVQGDRQRGQLERGFRGTAEQPVADEVGDRQPEERGQADDGVDVAAVAHVLVPFALEVERAEERDAGAREAEDRDRDELVVERPDAEQPQDRGAEEHPWTASCWLAVSMPAALRMWFDSFSPLAGSRSRSASSATGTPTSATRSDQRQLPVTSAMVVMTSRPTVFASGSEMPCQLNTRARACVG